MQRAGYYLTVLTWLGISGCSCSTNVGLNDNDAMVERDAAIEVHDSAQLKTIRRKMHRLKRSIHKATV